MVTMPVFAAGEKTFQVDSAMCDLIKRLQGVFGILRAAAFIGAAFYIAGWAWGYISGGEAKLDDIKKKSIALLVGFSLLLMIGLILSFVMSAAGLKMMGCDAATGGW